MIIIRADMKHDCAWTVGDGDKISIVRDPWMPNMPSPEIVINNNQGEELKRVSDLILQNPRRWNEELIQEVFDSNTAQQIL